MYYIRDQILVSPPVYKKDERGNLMYWAFEEEWRNSVYIKDDSFKLLTLDYYFQCSDKSRFPLEVQKYLFYLEILNED